MIRCIGQKLTVGDAKHLRLLSEALFMLVLDVLLEMRDLYALHACSSPVASCSRYRSLQLLARAHVNSVVLVHLRQ